MWQCPFGVKVCNILQAYLAYEGEQIRVSRNAIDIVSDGSKGRLYCKFSGTNQIDYTHNTFNLLLFDETRQIA